MQHDNDDDHTCCKHEQYDPGPSYDDAFARDFVIRSSRPVQVHGECTSPGGSALGSWDVGLLYGSGDFRFSRRQSF